MWSRTKCDIRDNSVVKLFICFITSAPAEPCIHNVYCLMGKVSGEDAVVRYNSDFLPLNCSSFSSMTN